MTKTPKITSLIKKYTWVNKLEKVSDLKESKVLKLTVKNFSNLILLGKTIEELDRFGVYRLYNVDVPPAQSFMYENDLFPLGKYKINDTWISQSSILETNYQLPSFTKINLKVNAATIKKFDQYLGLGRMGVYTCITQQGGRIIIAVRIQPIV